MGIKATIIGKDEWIARMQVRKNALPGALLDEMQTQMTQLADYVRGNKLSGQVLERRSGRLSRSISGSASVNGDVIVGRVGSSGVPYANIWENTGAKAHEVVPVNAKALRFMMGGRPVFAMRVQIPQQAPRPFLKPSMNENKEKILMALRARTLQVLRAT